MARAQSDRWTVATLGYAAGDAGNGVAYAALRSPDGRSESLVRVGFRCRPLPALFGRNVAYAALEAVGKALLASGVARVEFRIDDDALPLDLAERRRLPAALEMPYVALRCVLNRFAAARVAAAGDPAARDLSARARAEVSLGIAA